MDDEKIQFMWINILPAIYLLLVISSVSGVFCPNGCKCENEVLKTNCSGAGIEVVPIQLNPELHVMDLSHNKITQLLYTFTFYEKLHFLDISRNKIKIIGSGNFKTQISLTYLNLSRNYIESLEKGTFEGLKQLMELNLSNNKIESIESNAFKDLNDLIVLKLNGNQLDYFEEGTFKPTSNLQELYLDDNSFIEISSELSDLLQLKILSLARNLIEVIEDDKMPILPELSSLVLVQNLIFNIQPRGFCNLPKLDHLDISDNNLTILPTAPLAKLPNLISLKLSGNTFNYLPPVAFRGLFNLKYLTLTRIEALESIDARAFVDNINLEKVSMDFNYNVKILPTRLFYGNPKVRYVSIRYNSIKSLASTHFPLDQLHDLRIGGNPFDCNCSLEWLWKISQENEQLTSNISYSRDTLNAKSKLIKETNELKLDVNDVICDTPIELHNIKLVSAKQRQMDCSWNWLVVVSICLTVVFILSIITGVFFFIPRKISKPNMNQEIPKIIKSNYHVPPLSPSRKSVGNNEINTAERYIMPPIILHNRTLTLWDPYSQQCNSSVNIYEQLNDQLHRPHMVYV